jgi:hypothetical protein
MSPPLISKAAARYTGAGGKEHCSLCRHFSPRRGGRCARVLGDISPMGWCRLFSREMRGLVADASSFNGGGGPALSLDFMTPGTLDPRITFTRASTATYFDSAGVMKTAAVNAPRWDYDPVTRALRGLLIEEARTNLLPWSSDPTVDATWLKSGITSAPPTATANQTTAPDGTLTADRVNFPAVSAAGAVSVTQQTLAATAAIHTFSVYLKGMVGGEQTYISIRIGTTPYYTSPRITLTTSWQRYVVTSPANLTTAPWFFGVGTDLRDGTQTSTPAQGIYVWGAQLEQGAFATSYIPTTSAAVTRAADLCSMPVGSWFNAATGSLVVEAYAPPVGANAVLNCAWASLDDGTANNVMELRSQTGFADFRLLSFVGGVNSGASVSGNAMVANAIFKGAGTYTITPTSSRISMNGAAPPASTVGALPSAAMTTFRIGPSRGSSPNNAVRRVAYYARVLTDAEMQTVTTL